MKIERITMHHLRMELRAPFETSFGRIETRDCIIVELHAGGIVAYGECTADRDPLYSYENVATAWHILKDYLIPAALKNDIQDTADFQARVAFVRGHNMAKAGLEMALWDLFGKRDDLPLHEMLGGTKQDVAVGVSIGIKDSPEDLISAAEDYLELGINASRSRLNRAAMLRKAYLCGQPFRN